MTLNILPTVIGYFSVEVIFLDAQVQTPLDFHLSCLFGVMDIEYDLQFWGD